MKKLNLLFSFLLLLFGNLMAQEDLVLEKAIQLGLENNYDVKIAIENISLTEIDRIYLVES